MGLGPDTQVATWAVVVPVKRLEDAKSRLAVLGDDVRRSLALAFAEDVVLAASAARRVQVVLAVTDDEQAAAALAALGGRVVPDRPAAGIDAALGYGAGLARAMVPGCGVAAVSGDLPALTSSALDRLLDGVGQRAVVADADGTGTTVLAAPDGDLQPSYGPGSLARHRACGAVLLDAPPGVRRDVDTPEDLAEAARLGVGPHTRRLLARARAAACSPGGGTMLR